MEKLSKGYVSNSIPLYSQNLLRKRTIRRNKRELYNFIILLINITRFFSLKIFSYCFLESEGE